MSTLCLFQIWSPSSQEEEKLKKKLLKYNMMRSCRVLLEDIKLDKNFLFINNTVILNDRRNKFICYVCMAKFPTARDLSKHKYLHSESEDESETEDDLFEEEVEEEETSKPKSSKSPPKKKSNKLDISTVLVNNDANKTTCKKNTSSPIGDKLSEDVLPPDNQPVLETPFKCETCQIFFATADDAKLHKPSSKCKFSCKICKRKFNTLYAFVVHVMQHKANIEKNQMNFAYKCTLCECQFEDCFQLKRHEIITHKIKSNNSIIRNPRVPPPPLQYFKKQDTHTNSVVADSQDTPPDNTKELQPITAIDEENEIICELCYDVFNTMEELKSHMDFHKQLENKSDTIIIEDDDDVVEVIEDKRDPHEIKTTIKKASLPKTSISTEKYATLTPIYSSDKDMSAEKNKAPVSNQILTAKITDMLTPTHEKQAKTILLSAAVPNKIPKSQKKGNASLQQSTSLGISDNLQLLKTGPLSYSVIAVHKGACENPLNFSGSTEPQVTNESSTGSPKKISTESENFSLKVGISKINTNTTNTNFKFVIKSVSNSEPSTVSSSLSNLVISTAPSVQNTTTTTTLLPTITSSGISSATNYILTPDNNRVGLSSSQNPSTSAVNALRTFPNRSGVANTNFAYIINPSNNSPASTSSLNFNVPLAKYAYVIIPHQNNTTLTTTTKNMSKDNFTTETVSTIDDKVENNTSTIPFLGANTASNNQLSENITQHPDFLLSSQNTDIQMPLISNVTSLCDEPNYDYLPVITNVISTISSDENSANLDKHVSLPNIPASTTTTTSNIESISSYMISKPGPSSEGKETAIIIDSDSSMSGKEDETEMPHVTNEKSSYDSDSNEENLIIDENVESKSNTNNTNTEARKGFISVRNITELLAPKNTESSASNNTAVLAADNIDCPAPENIELSTSCTESNPTPELTSENTNIEINIDREINDTGNEENNDDPANKNKTKEKKERKWNFPMKCDGCSVVFQRYRAMRNHNERRLKCSNCNFRCCKIVNLKEHYILDHRKFFCGRCSFLADTKSQFKDHNSTTHTCIRCKGLYTNLALHICSTGI